MSGAFLLTRSGSMLKLSLVDKTELKVERNNRDPSCQHSGSCLLTWSGSRAVPKLLPDAKSIPKREEASLLGVLA